MCHIQGQCKVPDSLGNEWEKGISNIAEFQVFSLISVYQIRTKIKSINICDLGKVNGKISLQQEKIVISWDIYRGTKHPSGPEL